MQDIDKKTDHDIRREGLFARAVGRPAGANPYPLTSREGALWEEGWRMIDKDSDPHPMSSFRTVPDFTPAPSSQPTGRELPPKKPVPVVDMVFIAAAIVALVIGVSFALLR